MNYNLTDPYEIAKFIKESKKSTPVKVYINGNLDGVDLDNIHGNLCIPYGKSCPLALRGTHNSANLGSSNMMSR